MKPTAYVYSETYDRVSEHPDRAAAMNLSDANLRGADLSNGVSHA